MVCPFCNAEHERSLGVTRQPDGLVYQCWRAKCPARGFIASRTSNYDPHWNKSKPKKCTPKPFEYETTNLPIEYVEMYRERYDITKRELEENGFLFAPEIDRVVMPIYNALGYKVGVVARTYEQGFRGTKAISYFFDGKPHLHYTPYPCCSSGPIVCVEDIPSSIRTSRFSRSSALLGHGITLDLVNDLSEQTDEIILALDNDATLSAFKMKKKFRIYFNDIKVRILQKDPKEMTDEEIQQEIIQP